MDRTYRQEVWIQLDVSDTTPTPPISGRPSPYIPQALLSTTHRTTLFISAHCCSRKSWSSSDPGVDFSQALTKVLHWRVDGNRGCWIRDHHLRAQKGASGRIHIGRGIIRSDHSLTNLNSNSRLASTIMSKGQTSAPRSVPSSRPSAHPLACAVSREDNRPCSRLASFRRYRGSPLYHRWRGSRRP